ncbi:MAG: prepilin-type N-terminal cleavage/methylation domain-containing protein [Planctomycetota bacterium]
MSKRCGFTLIELLVVIAIIALLMSILMPALQRVKEQARTIKCLANLKQWNLIIAMYAEENDGNFYSGTTWEGFWWLKQVDLKIQDWTKNDLWFCPTATKPLLDMDGNRMQRFNIFSAWGIHHSDGLGPNGVSGSYGLNGYVLSTKSDERQFEGGRTTKNNWRTPNVPGGNNIPLMIGALRFDLWPIETDPPAEFEDTTWTDFHMARCCINRHEGFISSSFCDFSARKVDLKELWTLKWHKKFNITGPYTLAGGVQASDWPEWIRRFKDY